MKIVHLCISAFFCDNFSYQENIIAKYHVKQGHSVTVIASLFTYTPEGVGVLLESSSEYVNSDGVKVIRIAYKKPQKVNRLLRRYDGLYEKLECEHPDIIFSHNISAVDMSVVCRYMKLHPNVKLFADNHGDYINSGKNFFSKHILHPIVWRHYAQKVVPYLVKCYGVTPMRCRFLREMYKIPSEKIEFLPMGVDDDAIPSDRKGIRETVRKELGIADDDIVIITGGKIDKLKNTHLLLKAFQSIENRKLHLLICGVLTSEMDYLKDKFKRDIRIHYLGWCNAERVMCCMVSSDVACFPGTHSTLWEQSVGVGLPAIFKRWSEMEHVNINGNCVFVDGDNEVDIKNAILDMLSKDNLQVKRKLAEKASKTFLYSEISKKAIGL